MPKVIIGHIVEAAHGSGAPLDSSFWGIAADAFGEAEMPASFVVDVRPWAERKLAALRCHRTQMGPSNPIAPGSTRRRHGACSAPSISAARRCRAGPMPVSSTSSWKT
jgi:LmbE family N-acetylglucosaminyl deacetylase